MSSPDLSIPVPQGMCLWQIQKLEDLVSTQVNLLVLAVLLYAPVVSQEQAHLLGQRAGHLLHSLAVEGCAVRQDVYVEMGYQDQT
jgi:hypothetical protein